MIPVQLAGEVARWSSWLWLHQNELAPALRRLGHAGDYAQAALADPDGLVRRAGNTLLFGRPDGGQRVIAGDREELAKHLYVGVSRARGSLHLVVNRELEQRAPHLPLFQLPA